MRPIVEHHFAYPTVHPLGHARPAASPTTKEPQPAVGQRDRVRESLILCPPRS